MLLFMSCPPERIPECSAKGITLSGWTLEFRKEDKQVTICNLERANANILPLSTHQAETEVEFTPEMLMLLSVTMLAIGKPDYVSFLQEFWGALEMELAGLLD